MTDPSYAGQLITFTYPQIGNYGVSAEAMESRPDPCPGGDHARRGRPRRCARRRGRVAELADRPRHPGHHRRRHPCAGAPHPRRGAMRGGVFPARVPAGEARALIDGRAGHDRPRPGPRGGHHRARRPATDRESAAGRLRRFANANRHDRHRGQALDPAQPAQPRGHRHAAPLPRRPRRAAGRRARRGVPGQRAGRPGGAGLHRRDGPRAGRQAAGLRHLPRPPAALPRRRAGDLQAALRPSRRQPSGQGPETGRTEITSQNHGFAVLGPAGPGRSRPTSRCAGRPTSAPPS